MSRSSSPAAGPISRVGMARLIFLAGGPPLASPAGLFVAILSTKVKVQYKGQERIMRKRKWVSFNGVLLVFPRCFVHLCCREAVKC